MGGRESCLGLDCFLRGRSVLLSAVVNTVQSLGFGNQSHSTLSPYLLKALSGAAKALVGQQHL